MSHKKTFLSLAVVLLGALLAGCGGGGSSSGAAGGGRGGTSSSVVVRFSGGTAGLHGSPWQTDRLAAAVWEFMIKAAWAQVGGTLYLVDAGGNVVAHADVEDGQVAFAAATGDYYICRTPDLTDCTDGTVHVQNNEVLVVTVDDQLKILDVAHDDAADHIAEYGDPANQNKTIVCHQTGAGEFSISVASQAVLAGHMVHGDHLGYCVGDTEGSTGGPPSNGTHGPPEGVGRPEGVGPPEGVGNQQDT